MGWFAKWRVGADVGGQGRIEVSERGGVRYLHLGNDTIQSAMRIDAPYALELAYTRAMMACLLFLPDPRRFLMVGLGGGSLAKWVWRHLRLASTTVVEIDPEIVRVAHAWFCLPPEDERLRVVVQDAVDYVPRQPQSCEVLMLDGYDEHCQVEALGTPEFYAACREALRPEGVLVVNLWSTDPRFGTYVDRLFAAFDGRVLCLPVGSHSNVIAFAFRRAQNDPSWDLLRQRAFAVRERHGLDLLSCVDALRRLNAHNARRLFI